MKSNSLFKISSAVLLLSNLTCKSVYEPKIKITKSPNFILILADDLGYGDLGCYGNRLNSTPNIDNLAIAGTMFTDFYSCSLCTPARASLMTGCYPIRINMEKNYRGECVNFPVDEKGLNPDEITIADLLKTKDYKTALIGKWHLGDQKEFLPTRQGFDYFYGVPYSNDTPPGYVNRKEKMIYEHPPIPLLRNEEVIEAPVNQESLTLRYTEEAVSFIRNNKNNHFFLYLAHTMPHSPLYASKNFLGKSKNGLLGDVVEEIDWSVGEIIRELESLNLLENTMIIFTSDNGAPPNPSERSNAPLSGYKGTVMEGGIRVPFIVSWPGKIPHSKKCHQLSTMMDLFPTIANVSGIKTPNDRIIDGKNIWDLMSDPENCESPYAYFALYHMDQLQAIRTPHWKLHLPLNDKKNLLGNSLGASPLKLYNMDEDLAETNDLSSGKPEIVKELMVYATIARSWIGEGDIPTRNSRSAGYVAFPVPLKLDSK